ncbi:glycoside hydrolase family 13 protein [Azoarcus olearius]|uniref:Alpha-amylase n=1 Tax=Azoarcus sp. (strain BH72) TaxID=418699 RepID=A1K7X2_AZOSB|nr:alpha-glucosidase [Azoarcus olearius]CAL94927.1 putative alpha-D-1,4-glucosidase [Azoarcus olearius]
MKTGWWRNAVVYQVYPRSFMDSNGDGIGDLPGLLQRLDYLQWLGVTVIWLCPMFRSPNDDNGYDISDYQDIHPEFGTMADLDRLLEELHRRGMRLVLDLVLNHTSDEHPWFIESRSSRDNPRRNWYVWRDGRNGGPPNNWESIFKGSAWAWDEATGQYYLHLFTRRQPDLNWENPEVRTAMAAMVRWWLDKGVDGFRIDAVTHMKKAPGFPDAPNPQGLEFAPAYGCHMCVPGVLDFVDELARTSFARYDVMTVGEANGVSAAQAVEWVGEDRGRLDMILQFEHWHLWSNQPRVALDVRALKTILTRWQLALAESGWNALYLENHDLPRVLSRWGDTVRYRYESATALAAMYFLMRGTPFIYQGQELGMANTVFTSLDDFRDRFAYNRIERMRAAGMDDADILAEMSLTARDNSRTPMPWNNGPNAGFTTGIPWLAVNPEYPAINVATEREEPRSVLNFYRALIALRTTEPVLAHGRYRLVAKRHPQVYAYLRESEEGRFLVVCNLTAEPATFSHRAFPWQRVKLRLGNYPTPRDEGEWGVLRAFEARVVEVG